MPSFLVGTMALFVALPALAKEPNPKRVVAEDCVWAAVQKQLAVVVAVPNDIDTQLKVGRDAVALCEDKIIDWARTSPAVLESGEPVAEVNERMRIHLTARAALFTQGKARPFYLEQDKPKQSNGLAPPAPAPSTRK